MEKTYTGWKIKKLTEKLGQTLSELILNTTTTTRYSSLRNELFFREKDKDKNLCKKTALESKVWLPSIYKIK